MIDKIKNLMYTYFSWLDTVSYTVLVCVSVLFFI
jgi:hypothetical protein